MVDSASEGKKRALVISDSDVKSDPRVLNQITWLVNSGWLVDTLGQGTTPAVVNGRHFALTGYPFPVRLLSYLLLPNAARFRLLMESTIPTAIRHGAAAGPYDLLVVNEIDLLPWATANAVVLVKPGPEGHRHLDLHEYSPNQGNGFVWQWLIGKYRTWLTSFIPSAVFDTRSVVSPGIADLYVRLFGIKRPAIVRSCPAFVAQRPSSVSEHGVRLVHHGKADLDRGLDLLIDAMKFADDRFSLTLMLVGSPATVRKLKVSAARLGTRVAFRDPVDVGDVASALNEYDLEVIFFPPTTENLRFVLPNKFFEAIQGRLGIVTGASVEIVNLVQQFGNGAVVPGWTAADLATTLNGLDAERVSELKANSNAAAAELSSERESERFLSLVGVVSQS